jgi:hypothetical protein
MPTSKRAFLAALAGLPAAAVAGPALAAVPGPRQAAQRVGGTGTDQERAGIPGLPGARFAADRVDAFQAALGTAPILSEAPWLALSTGGENGAFGAGLLAGWSEAGTRPRYAVVTGVSTGALIAPFAFAGPRFDASLRQAYTAITAADVFEIGATDTSLLDTWPLGRMIARFVTPDLLAAVAAEHATGRRLFVVTTNLDTGRPVAWNMGVIAAKGDAAARKLFCDVLLASGSIPGLFPPVAIEVSGPDRALQELHADGGIAMPFFVAPEAMLAGARGGLPTSAGLPAREVQVIVNNRLEPEFQATQRSLMSVIGNALSAAVKASVRASLAVHGAFARGQGITLRVATIGAEVAPSPGPFDGPTMRALFEHGRARAGRGEAFDAEPVARVARQG